MNADEFMKLAREIAAQCWCDDETKDRVMDVALAESFAKRLAWWMERDARRREIARIIEGVDNRCMAVDGPVTPTRLEITDKELKDIYALAKGK